MSSMQGPARLVLYSYDGEIIREYVLDEPQVTVGRAASRDIALPDDKLVSRHHLVMSQEQGGYILRDEGSSNGTYINGQLIEIMHPHMLQEGDQIALGRHQFVFHQSAPAQREAEAPSSAKQAASAAVGSFQPAASEQVFPHSSPDTELPPPDVSRITRFQATAPMRVVSADRLRFSTFYPRAAAIGDWYSFLFYAYPQQAGMQIQEDAVRYREGVEEEPAKLSSSGNNPLLLQGIPITVVPECEGMLFNPKRQTVTWTNAWHRLEFRGTVREETIAVHHGRLSVFSGPLLLGSLPLTIQTVPAEDEAADEADVHVSSEAYKQIFASYSRDDTVIMMMCRYIYRMLGFSELARVDAVRFGDIEEKALQHLIAEAEVFQLFWSEHAVNAPYVTREWEYALSLQRGDGFLRPVYWNVPLVRPPETLRHIPFTYLPRYTFVPQRQ